MLSASSRTKSASSDLVTGGKNGQARGDVAWLEFTHLTERKIKLADGTELPGDMGLHTHFLIPNGVFGPGWKGRLAAHSEGTRADFRGAAPSTTRDLLRTSGIAGWKPRLIARSRPAS